MTIAVLDLDWVKYTVASAGEKRSIKAIHNSTGDEFTFSNRTEMYGGKKSKDGGWLEDFNKAQNKDWVHSDFTIEDIQTPDVIENVLFSAKNMVERALSNLGTTKYKSFVGKGDSFRVERSTLLKYKGKRIDNLKPVYLNEVSEYLAKKYKAEIVTGIENDDRVVMEAYKKQDHVVVGVDKDFCGCPIKFFNVNRVEEGIINGNCLGRLARDDKGKVRGFGRMFSYFQTCSQDTTDNYAANCFSDLKWADVSAYNALCDSKSDKEAWLNIEKVFKKLYPEPKKVIGWRGNEILIDWEYVMNECFDLARMLRFEGDVVIASDVLKGFK